MTFEQKAAAESWAFESAHPELQEIFRRQGARAYHNAMTKILREERDWPEIIYEDILDAETIDG